MLQLTIIVEVFHFWLRDCTKDCMQPSLNVLIVTLSENAGRINDEDDKVNLNTLTHFIKKTEHAFNGVHAYISVLTHVMYNT